MARRIKLKPHLDVDELAKRYRESADGITRSHWQILWLLAEGKSSRAISEMTGYSMVWIQALARRYNAAGPAAMGDQRHHNPGSGQALTAEQTAQLHQAVLQAEAAGQPLNGVQVAQRMSSE